MSITRNFLTLRNLKKTALGNLPLMKLRATIDPELEERLKERGMGDKVEELKQSVMETDFTSVFPEAIKDTSKVAETTLKYTVGGHVLGKSVGGALATPFVNQQMKESLSKKMELQDKVMERIKRGDLSMDKKKKLLNAINYKSPDFIADAEKDWYQTSKEIYGDAARLSLSMAMMYKGGVNKAGLDFKMISGTQMKAVQAFHAQTKAITEGVRLAKWAQMGKVGKALKVAHTRGIPLTKVGLAGGTEEMLFSFSRGEGMKDNLKSFKRGFAFSVVATVALEGVIRAGTAVASAGKKHVFDPIFSKAVNKLQDAAFEVPTGLQNKLEGVQTRIIESVDIAGSKQYSEFPAEMLYQNADELGVVQYTPPPTLTITNKHRKFPLEEVIQNPRLYEKYPDLKSVKVRFGNSDLLRGGHASAGVVGRDIIVNDRLIKYIADDNQVSVLRQQLEELARKEDAGILTKTENKLANKIIEQIHNLEGRDGASKMELTDDAMKAIAHEIEHIKQQMGVATASKVPDEFAKMAEKFPGLSQAEYLSDPLEIQARAAESIYPTLDQIKETVTSKAILTPNLAQDRVKDIAGKLNLELAGPDWAKMISSRVDVNNTTSQQLYETSMEVVSEFLESPKGRQILGVASRADNVTNEVLSTLQKEKSWRTRFAKKALNTIESIQEIPTKYLDRFHSLEMAENDLFKLKGKLDDPERFYRNMRLAQSKADGQATLALRELFGDVSSGKAGQLSEYADVEDLVKSRAMLLDYIDRAKLGDFVPGGYSQKQLEAMLQKHIAEAGSQNSRVMGAITKIQDYNTSLLKETLEEGLIDQALYQKLLDTHPNYLPHRVVQELDNEALKTFNMQDSMNVFNNSILRSEGGTIGEIEDPLEAIVWRTRSAKTVIENNKVIKGLVEAQEASDFIEGMYPLTDDLAKKAKDIPTVSFFRNGVKETWAVPKDIEVAIKGVRSHDHGFLFNGVRKVQQTFKKFATQLNVSFSFPNLARDRQTAVVTAQIFIDDLAKRSGNPDFVKLAEMTADEVRDLYTKSGGFGASIFSDGKPPQKSLEYLKERGMWQEFGEKVNPVELVESLNDAMEQSTRMAVFKKGLIQGLSPEDAALASRDATIDFAKMGTKMKELNQVIPFLNARVQGFNNMIKAGTLDPAVFARLQYWTGVLPVMAIHNWNSQFQSYKESGIDEYLENNYWNIIVGEEEVVGSDGEVVKTPNIISVKMGEAQSLVANPVKWFLKSAEGLDNRSVTKMIGDTLGSATPVSFQTWNGTDPWGALISQLGPVATIPVGLATNVDPWRGRDIVPSRTEGASPELQARPTTPEVVKSVAKILNYPAAKIEFILNSFGGVPQDLTQGLNLLSGLAQGEGLRVNPLTDSNFGTASQLPVSRRFFRQQNPDYAPLNEVDDQAVEETSRPLIDETVKVYDEARKIYQEMNRLPSNEAKREYLNSLPEMSDEVKAKIKSFHEQRFAVDGIRKKASTNDRASAIVIHIEAMKANGESKEAVNEWLAKLKATGILSDTVADKIRKLKQAPVSQGALLEGSEDASPNVEEVETKKYKEIPSDAVVFRMPDHLGGGEFATLSDGTPVILERDNSALFQKYKNQLRNGSFDQTSLEIDHVMSMALGGTNTEQNLQGLESPRSLLQIASDFFSGDTTPVGARPISKRQGGKYAVEIIAIWKYRKGEISLPQARLAILNWNNNPEALLGVSSSTLRDEDVLNQASGQIRSDNLGGIPELE